MLNFNYSIPTRVFFGKDKINTLSENIKEYGNKILLVYGGGSIKKTGLYDDIVKIFKNDHIKYFELEGVKPNPRIDTVRKGIQICKENDIDLVLAVGGGSVIDASKVIAAGVHYDGDAWDIVLDPRKIYKALPIATILTLAATGSEMDAGAVITNPETKQKLGTGSPNIFPKFSILDPTYTFSVPKNQTAAGVVDIMSHVFEVYFSKTNEAYLQNRMAEAVLKTCINYGPKVMSEPENYEARANLMWAGSLAINGLLAYGKETEWSAHEIEHELSAYYDITHGVGLAILFPYWMEYVLSEDTVDKFVEYGINVWDIDKTKDKFEIAKSSIEKTRDFFNSLDMPSTLSDVDIDDKHLDEMAKGAVARGTLGSFKALEKEDVFKIYQMSL
ncbi:MAG: iron-containing alcohol dehydrogenase [Senegalia sp. (in: firmicutes)]|uniref:iron-containing alcohol dehydrogenase n=1 Tax=Senegalia sp. (in: firmicutes) TaxID=1924098 RepID=UPI003F9E9A53